MPLTPPPPEQQVNTDRVVGLLLAALVLFASPLFDWVIRERAPWYSLFVLWGLFIGLIWFAVGRRRRKRGMGERR